MNDFVALFLDGQATRAKFINQLRKD